MNNNEKKIREEIIEYYQRRASTGKYQTSPDFHLREIEIEHLKNHLEDGINILDVGCGNGYSTLCFTETYDSSFTGIDFAPDMIVAAKKMKETFKLQGKVEFRVGDVMDLEFSANEFDIVISERCLLNIPTRNEQWKALHEIARVLKPNGKYLMLEGTLQGLQRLNKIRNEVGLESIPEAAAEYNWFSNKFDEEELINYCKKIFKRLEYIQRFGMYYFISRVIHPLLVAPAEPTYDAPINAIAHQICSKIPNYGDIGHVALFIFRK